MKRLLICVMVVFMLPASVGAYEYDIDVSRSASNVYKLDSKNVYVYTQNCFEHASQVNSILIMNGFSGTILFSGSENICDVKSVYGPDEQVAGKYSVVINQRDNNWYEIGSQEIYIKTIECSSFAARQEAKLSVNLDGGNALNINGEICDVEGIYTRMSL